MFQRLQQTYNLISTAIEEASIPKNVIVNVVNQTPTNWLDYLLSFCIAVVGAFFGGLFAFQFNRKQEGKKQEYNDGVERIEKIYVPLCILLSSRQSVFWKLFLEKIRKKAKKVEKSPKRVS